MIGKRPIAAPGKPMPARSRPRIGEGGRPSQTRTAAHDRFDAAFYRRFYVDPRTRVSSRAAVARLARFVHGYLGYLGIPVRAILDAGCGVGFWRDAAASLWPRARYSGIEVSDYLCRRYGWTRASIVDYKPARQFDLIVCQSVLQYLSDRDAAQAIDNLSALARGAVYLEAPTAEDWKETCDRRRTDGSVRLRPARWYRRRLARHFVAAGGGVFVARSAAATLYALERAGD
jgi:SAM-dependent methyltransferase